MSNTWEDTTTWAAKETILENEVKKLQSSGMKSCSKIKDQIVELGNITLGNIYCMTN
jgi:hypothetical protein